MRVSSKKTLIASTLALAGAFASACGGSGGPGGPGGASPPSAFPIKGTVSGLSGSTVVLTDNVGDNATISSDGPFTLATPIAPGAAYSVIVAAQPATPPQFCTVSNATGTVGFGSPSVAVTCLSRSLKSQLIDLGNVSAQVVPDVNRHRVYATTPERNELVVLDGDTYLVVTHFFVGSGPKAMALSADGASLYVALSTGGAIAIVNLTTLQVTNVPVASAIGTSAINSLVELKPGVLLIGASGAGLPPGPFSGRGNLATIDLGNGNAVQPVAGTLVLQSVSFLLRSADGTKVYGIGTTFPSGPGAGSQTLFSLDATQSSLPLIATHGTSQESALAESLDGMHLVGATGSIYDTQMLAISARGSANPGVVGATADRTVILQTNGSVSFERIDGQTLNETTYSDDCPDVIFGSMTAMETRGEWLFAVATSLCAVSLDNPTQPPGVPGSRALPPNVPDPVLVPWSEVADGYVNDIAFDNPRGVVYTANGYNHTVDTVTLGGQTIIQSIPVGGLPQVIRLSADGNTVYAGLSDTGEVVTIDVPTSSVTSRVNLTTLLGTPIVFRIAELSPGHVLASAIPSQGGIGPNTYLVDVTLSDPTSARRVGCAIGYDGAQPIISPDHHYLYVLNATSCPPEKRDLTSPEYPVVASGPLGGYGGGNGLEAISPDGARIFSGAAVIDTSTMEQVALIGGNGIALASKNPDIYYQVLSQTISTIELHDLRILSIVQNACQSTLDAVDNVAISADEKTVIAVGNGYSSAGAAGALCITQIAP